MEIKKIRNENGNSSMDINFDKHAFVWLNGNNYSLEITKNNDDTNSLRLVDYTSNTKITVKTESKIEKEYFAKVTKREIKEVSK